MGKVFEVAVDYHGYFNVEAESKEEAIEIATRLPFSYAELLTCDIDFDNPNAVREVKGGKPDDAVYGVWDLIDEGIISSPEELWW